VERRTAEVETHGITPAPVPPARVGLAVALMALVFAVLLFAPAGRLDWTPGWLYLGLITAYVCITWACLLRWNPELIAYRMRFGEGTKTWDKLWAALFAPVMIAVYVVAGCEARAGASGPTGSVWLLGLAIFVAGSALLTGSMVVNPFFEKTVRIQTDRGHRVIDTGPYAYVRHPGYVGFAGWMVATPLLLGSSWAFGPVLLSLVGIVIRTALEDRTLQAELSGYTDYARRVRFRLVPGVW
jgi:protein-S-isoprenylcysteine O-methyltransferase Ste14